MEISPKCVSLTVTGDVQQICTPLKRLKIKFFNYTRFYADGSITSLITDPHWLTYFVRTQIDASYKLKNYDTSIFLWSEIMSNQVLTKAREHFKLDHLLQFQQSNERYCDLYAYGSDPGNHGALSNYFSNLDLLQDFNKFFKEESSELFLRADNDRIIPPKNTSSDISKMLTEPLNQLPTRRQEFLATLLKTRSCHSDKNISSLTKRELLCVYWLARGFTSKDIARKLGISYRTVQKHLENAKRQLDCFSKSQLLEKYHDVFSIIEREPFI